MKEKISHRFKLPDIHQALLSAKYLCYTVSMDKIPGNIKLFLLDLDGTLYVGGKAVEGAADKVREILGAGRQVCYLTNNSSRSTADYKEKLFSLGFPLGGGAEIYTSGASAVEHIKRNYPYNRVYLLGTESLRKEFTAGGLDVIPFSENEKLQYASLRERKDAIAAVGFDTSLTYENLNVACGLIKDGAEYVATNPDRNCPAPYGEMPDAGTLIALIESFSGRLPDAICGKPFSIMADGIRRRYDLPENEIAMVGDSLSSDIKFAQNNGFFSVLALSGCTGRRTLAESAVKPDMVINSIRELLF